VHTPIFPLTNTDVIYIWPVWSSGINRLLSWAGNEPIIIVDLEFPH